IAAFESPDAAAGSDVDVVNAFLAQRLGATNIVLPEGVAAVDDDVIAVEQLCQGVDGGLGNLAGGQHDPDGAGLFQFLDELFQSLRSGRSVRSDRGDGLAVLVVDDG